MNSAPHLLNEDRQEYERILDEALRSAQHSPDLAAIGDRLSVEQLRTMALNATALITAAAATEYRHFVEVRTELRRPSARRRTESAPQPGPGAVGLATTLGGVTETAGAGLVAVLAVLAPMLAGTAAVIFLLIGYVLKMVSPERAVADALLTTGWVFAALTAAGILVAAVGLLLTALRNAPTSLRADAAAERDAAIDVAREAWRQALLERGVLPFFREALTSSGSVDGGTVSEKARMPQLGYHRPGFSSPDGGPDAGPPPSYSSPDFSSPDFGGPEHKPE